MKYVTKSTKSDFNAILARRNHKSTVALRRILKNGKPGAVVEYEMFGDKTAAEVIARLEKLNPGCKWIEA